MKSRLIVSVVLLLLICATSAQSQPTGFLNRYSTEEGLIQSTISDIIQDERGFIWLATFDGLVRFDGYEFKNHKLQAQKSLNLKSNRINFIANDKYGRIWLKSNANEAYCYDITKDKFWSPDLSEQLKGIDFSVSSIKETPSGRIWLLSDHHGAICVSDSTYSCHLFDQKNQLLKGSGVYNVLEDQDRNTWLLTNNGLGFISGDDLSSVALNFTDEENAIHGKRSFYSALEVDNEIWFGASRGQIWRYSRKTKAFYDFSLDTKSNIRDIIRLNKDEIVIVTSADGFFLYNLSSGEKRHYNKANLDNLSLKDIAVLHTSPSNQIWFTNEGIGIYKFDFSSDVLSYYFNYKENPVVQKYPQHAFVLQDGAGRLWIQPKGGCFSFYDFQTDELKPFYPKSSPTGSDVSVVIYSAFFDKQDNLWFYSSADLLKYTFYKNQFKRFPIADSVDTGVRNFSLAESSVRSVFEDRNENIWVATRGSRLALFNSGKEWIGYLSPEGKIDNKEKWNSIIYSIMQDSRGNIWIGTKGSGLYRLTPTPDPFTFDVVHFTKNESDPYSISDNEIYSIFQDRKQRIWIGTWGGGLNLIDDQAGGIRFLHSENDLISYPKNTYDEIRCITEDDNGIIHLGTTDGLLSFSSHFDRIEKATYRRYNHLVDNDINCILASSTGKLYLGTGGGFYHSSSTDSVGFPVEFHNSYQDNHLSISERILNIIEDANGKIWIVSQKNLFCLDAETSGIEIYSEVKRLIGDNIFSESSECLLANGEIMLGYSDGIIHFNTADIKRNEFVPYVGLTDFEIFNQPVETAHNAVFTGPVDETPEVVLSHNQNFFKIHFAALDFSDGKHIQYKYKLEGLEDEWNYSNEQRTATYTKAPRGEYVFKISSTNGSGIWVDNERHLNIVVRPAFWETNIAFAAYILLAIGLFIVIQKTILTIFRLRQDVKMQSEMADMKLKFFTDISHEIRTPLTMVTMPIEHLIDDKGTPNPIRDQLQIVQKSANRLLNLVNQILDIRKMQDRKLKIEKVDLAGFVNKLFNEFTELAVERKIDLQLSASSDTIYLWADRDCLDKMIMNLLSNAFKFCPDNSRIKVAINQDEKVTVMKVIDNGPGISPEKLKKLFVRFSNFNDDPAKPSSGIGLSLVKEMADKHSASIRVESEVGKGSAFIVTFANGYSHFSDDIEIAIPETAEPVSKPDQQPAIAENVDFSRPKPLGLLVEDDDELRTYMRKALEKDFSICEAVNGDDGYQKAASLSPDFIITDIMMPRKNGIELLKNLREDIATSHIPIVLLTAKSNIESKIESLQFGADDYITKPFSLVYFKARISNLLEQRKRLQQIYSSGNFEPRENPPPVSPKDREFMDNLIAYIRDHIEDNTLVVDDLARVVGMSRTPFFRKIKSLTGNSPVEFVRNIRLKHAARLMTSEGFLVKEACYASGFSDLKYFGKCFKEKYNVTPAEYRKRGLVKTE